MKSFIPIFLLVEAPPPTTTLAILSRPSGEPTVPGRIANDSFVRMHKS
jgi:hypothetical protein